MKNLLVKSMSKGTALEIVKQVAGNEHELDSLLDIALNGNPPHSMKAAWIYRHVSEKDNNHVTKNYQKILTLLPSMPPNGIARDLLRSFLNFKIPEDNLGSLANLCLHWLASYDADTAVKYNCMHLLESICKKWPELSQEFLSVLEGQKNKNTKAFDRYSLNFIKRVEKLRNQSVS